MIILTANDGSLKNLKTFREYGYGRLILATAWKDPKDLPWGLDNGAFGAWKRGEPFPEKEFLAGLGKVPEDRPPFMAVCPDLVADFKSLEFSRSWRDRLEDMGYGGFPWYLALQDGMMLDEVREELATERWAGLFVGGTRPWKWASSESWVALAHDVERACHIGRIASLKRLVWADRIGADSVDSSQWWRADREGVIEAYRRQDRLRGLFE